MKEKKTLVFEMIFFRYILCLSLSFAVLLTTLVAGAAEPGVMQEGPPGSKSYVQLKIGDYFSCEVPADWSRSSNTYGLSQEEKKTYGVSLQGPWSGEVPVRISVYYYAEGNLLYRSSDKYIRLFSKPALGVALEGSSYGQVVPTVVSGRDAVTFDRLKNEFVPVRNTLGSSDKPAGDSPKVYERREMMARPVPVKERFVVVPAGPGFYAMRYTAPAEKFREFLPVFEKVIATFHPMR